MGYGRCGGFVGGLLLCGGLLKVDEGGVMAGLVLDEVIVRPCFHDFAVLDNGDEVGVADGGESMGNDDGGAADGGFVECLLDDTL